MEQLETEQAMSLASVTANTGSEVFYNDKIKKLAKLTEEGKVKWRTVDSSSIPALSFTRILTAYEASFGGERLRLIETGYEKQNFNLANYTALSSLFPKPKTNEMESIVLSLHLLDRNGRPTFKFPSVEAVYDLLNEVKLKQSDVAGFLLAIDAAVESAGE